MQGAPRFSAPSHISVRTPSMKGKAASDDDEVLKLLGKKKETLARQLLGSDDEEGENDEANVSHVDVEAEPDEEVRPLPMKRAAALYAASKAKKESKDEDTSDEDDAEFHDGYGDDLIGDENDRMRLMAMTEVEREAILFERSTERQRKRERWELKQKLRAERSTRQALAASKESALKSVSRKLLTKDTPARKPARSASSEEEGEEEYRRLEKPKKYRSDIDKREYVPLDMVIAMQLTRSKIEEWLYRSFFKTELRGMFIRRSVGPNLYEAHRIEDIIDYRKIYVLNKTDCKYAFEYMKHGQKRHDLFTIISNSPITQNEYNIWLSSWEKEHPDYRQRDEQPITLSEAKELAARLNDLSSRPRDKNEIAYMLTEKRRCNTLKMNPATEKAILTRDRETALTNDHLTEQEKTAEIERIDARLEELEERQKDVAVSESDRLHQIALINKKNRELNILRAHEAEMEQKRIKLSKKDSALDPTARRKTRSTFGDAIAAASMSTPDHPPAVTTDKTEVACHLDDHDHGTDQVADELVNSQPQAPSSPSSANLLDDIEIDFDILQKYGSSNKSSLSAKTTSMPTPAPYSFLQKYKKERGLF